MQDRVFEDTIILTLFFFHKVVPFTLESVPNFSFRGGRGAHIVSDFSTFRRNPCTNPRFSFIKLYRTLPRGLQCHLFSIFDLRRVQACTVIQRNGFPVRHLINFTTSDSFPDSKHILHFNNNFDKTYELFRYLFFYKVVTKKCSQMSTWYSSPYFGKV